MKFPLDKIVPSATPPNQFLRYQILPFGFSAFWAIISGTLALRTEFNNCFSIYSQNQEIPEF
jgi:hypothetical protein